MSGAIAQPWEYVVVTVRDTGTGMEPWVRARLFEPYFTTKATGVKGRGLGGHGLGLYFIKKILEAHKGRIHVQSEPTRWTRFTVELPASTPGSVSHAA